MDDFVRGWREGDAELLSSVVDMDEGRITWVSGQGVNEQVGSMTFAAAVARNRTTQSMAAMGGSWFRLTLSMMSLPSRSCGFQRATS